jgi:plastocyanin
VSARECLGIALGVAALGGCISDRPTTAPEQPGDGGAEVEILDFAFRPPTLSVPVVSTVTWTNADGVVHTVSADDGQTFDSGAFGQGTTFSFTAAQAGIYGYFCQVHPFMKGTLTVTP